MTDQHWIEVWAPVATWLGIWGGMGSCLLPLGRQLRKVNHSISEVIEHEGVRVFVAADAIDKFVFGARLISWRSFVVSSIMTYVMCLGILVLIHLVFLEWIDGLIQQILLFCLVVWVLNFLPDYLSVIFTRRVLRWVKNPKRSTGTIFIAIFVDLVATFVFATPAVALFMQLPNAFDFSVSGYDWSAWYIFAIFSFLTSFTTTLWLWIYLLGWGVATFTSKTARPIELFGWVLAPAAYGCFLVAILGVPILFFI